MMYRLKKKYIYHITSRSSTKPFLSVSVCIADVAIYSVLVLGLNNIHFLLSNLIFAQTLAHHIWLSTYYWWQIDKTQLAEQHDENKLLLRSPKNIPHFFPLHFQSKVSFKFSAFFFFLLFFADGILKLNSPLVPPAAVLIGSVSFIFLYYVCILLLYLFIIVVACIACPHSLRSSTQMQSISKRISSQMRTEFIKLSAKRINFKLNAHHTFKYFIIVNFKKNDNHDR